MNKELWKGYTDGLPCPRCEQGILQYSGESLVRETQQSLIDNEFHRNGLVNPDSIYLCTAFLKCIKCEEIVITSYRRIDDVRNVDQEGNEVSVFEPLHYFPAPPIIKIPSSCPTELEELLQTSFQLFWVDLGSCANKIRTSIECLLNLQNITNVGTLHNRIETFKKTNDTVGAFLLAIKWIGNSGSHQDAITQEAVLDGYELLEYALEKLYNDKEQRLIALSKKINDNKGHA